MLNNASRRKAIQKISLGIAGIMLPKSVTFADRREQKPDKKVGIALVGLGNYSTLQLAPALLETNSCYLAGIVTGSPDKAKVWSAKYNIPEKNIYNYKNFDDIRNNPDIDVVYVVLPNFLHAEYTIRAAKAGKHVICEKPLAMNVEEGEQMLAACREANVKLGVGYRLYHEPNHLEIIRLAGEQIYGKVKIIESSLGFTVPPLGSWRLDKKIGGGGAIMDLGVYAIQGARRAVNELPISVTAQAFTFNKERFKDIYETVFWQFEFPGGAVAHSSTSYSSYVDRLYITCEKGWLEISPAYNAKGVRSRSINGELELKVKNFQQIDQMDAFANSVINNTPLLASGEEGLKDIKLIEAILKAAETGRKVMIG